MTSRSARDTVQRPGGDAAVVRVHGTQKGAGDHHRLHAALLLCRPVRRRKAGDRRSLSQPLRGRRQAAGDHQLPQLRQPAAARDHGPVRRLPRRHGRSLPRARLPDRERQRLALQREQGDRRRQRDPADARRSAASACSTIGRSRRPSRSRPRARRSCFSAIRPAMSASRSGSTSVMAAATARRRRSIFGRAPARRTPAAADRPRPDHRGARRQRWRRRWSPSPRWRLAGGIGAQIEPPNVPNPAAILFGEDQGRGAL